MNDTVLILSQLDKTSICQLLAIIINYNIYLILSQIKKQIDM